MVTEQATSRGRSRSFSNHGHTTVSRNDSDQRRALLLPQEFKEIGSEREIIVVENCKPILADKIRYYRDEGFKERLLPAPAVPAMDLDLHLARVQQRWRLAADELADGEGLDIDQLAHDFSLLPDNFDDPADKLAETLLNFFTAEPPSGPSDGGAVESLADEDGVLLAEHHAEDQGRPEFELTCS